MDKETLAKLLMSDEEFLLSYNYYHPEVESNSEAIINDNWNKIKDLNIISTDYGYFAVDTKTDIIPWIVGFYVKPECRKNHSLVEDMKKETDGMFLVCVSNNNEKAVKFLNKFCKVMNKDNVKTIFYCKRGF